MVKRAKFKRGNIEDDLSYMEKERIFLVRCKIFVIASFAIFVLLWYIL
jgi:hypothetical protein